MISLVPVARVDAPTLQNLFQLYTHDFSEYWAGEDRGDLQPDGRFADYPLDPYWSRSGWSAQLIRHGSALAGFVLVNGEAHSGQPVDANMAEFFVVLKYCGAGVGLIAAEAAFAQRPGSWEVAVARKNRRAADFWLRTIASSPRISHLVERESDNAAWKGPIYRFNCAAG